MILIEVHLTVEKYESSFFGHGQSGPARSFASIFRIFYLCDQKRNVVLDINLLQLTKKVNI